MPVQPCRKDGKPGFRWGKTGKCYTYTLGNEAARKEAERRARIQGYAIQKDQERRGETPE